MRFLLAILWLGAYPALWAQQGASAIVETGPSVAPSPAASPAPSVAASPTPAASPSPADVSPAPVKKQQVKLQFLPPPMDGVFALGIFDRSKNLVRVLEREAKTDDFAVAADGLIANWDGLDDDGKPAPAGKYRAHGYCVGVKIGPDQMTILAYPGVSAPLTSAAGDYNTPEHAQPAMALENGKPFVAQPSVRLHLVGNPLDRDRAGDAQVTVGFDAKGSWLKLTDGLPLKQISASANLKWAVIGPGPKADTLAVFQSDGETLEHFTVTQAAQMMAFDCGEFDYDPDK